MKGEGFMDGYIMGYLAFLFGFEISVMCRKNLSSFFRSE
jgi:hypothetical protein